MHAFMLAVLLSVVFGGKQVKYAAINLGTLPGDSSSQALAINNAGIIVGQSSHQITSQAVYWDEYQKIHSVSGGSDKVQAVSSVAERVSDAGHVTVTTDGTSVLFFMLSEGFPGGQNYVELEPLSAPYGVNSDGVVVGMYLIETSENHACMWQDGIMTDIFPEHSYSVATSVNTRGDIAGFFQSGSSLGMSSVAFVRADNGQVTCLPTLGGAHAIATDINSSSMVVGYSWLAASGYHHACLWHGGKVTDLGTLGGNNSEAIAVNNHGLVVGYSGTSSGSSFFIWSKEWGMLDLRDLIITPNFRLEQITDVNDNGDIVGWGYFQGSQSQHACVLRPVQ
jgi:probable HAF family extracellular repeat protein